MTHQPDLSTNVLPAEDLESRSYTLAQRISQLFHPLLLNVVLFMLVGYFALDTRLSGMGWAAVCLLAQALPPTVFFTLRQRQGAYSDEDVSQRHQRNELYLFALGTIVAGLVILPQFGLPRPFLDLLVAACVIGIVNGLINLFWKISAHATSVASLATVALLYSSALGVALWLCALAVGWARIRTRNHTPAQVLAGFAVATTAVLFAFGVVG